MENSKKVLDRIRHHVELVGTPLTKLGEVLGSKAKDRQSKISAAKLFLAGKARSFSLERIQALSKFYDKDFLNQKTALMAASPRADFGVAVKVEKANEKQLDKLLVEVSESDTQLLRGVKLSSLSVEAKRLILRAYYR